MSKHVKLLLENVQKPSCTPLGNPAEAETRRGNFDIKLRLSEKRQESSSFMERRKSTTKTPSSSLKEDTDELVNTLNRMLQSAQNDAAEIAAALGRIAKNYGMSRLARETGLSRESLYRTLSGQCSPEFSTILKIIRALNLNFAVTENPSK